MTVKPIYSLSGAEMTDVCDDDRILVAICDTEAKAMTADQDGRKLIGPFNAIRIRQSLIDAGFRIVRS